VWTGSCCALTVLQHSRENGFKKWPSIDTGELHRRVIQNLFETELR
jgi:hypothetical protein